MSVAQTRDVAFVLPIGLTLGGSNTWCVGTARHLAPRGWRPVLVEHTCVQWHPRWNVEIPGDVRLLSCPGTTPADASERDVPGYADVYRGLLPATMIPNWGAAVYAACARLSVEDPAALRVIGVGHGHGEQYQSLLRYYEPLIHVFLAKNAPMAEALKRAMPHRAADVFMHPYVVDIPASNNRRPRGASEPIRLAYAGRITDHEKRVSNFVPLARELGRLGVNFSLRIIGEGGYKKWLLHEISELPEELRKRIRVDAMLLPEQLSEAWRETDVCLLVSNTESGGISMLEAMAQGCVPVSTRTPGPSTFIRDGENGFLTEIDDMGAMARILQRLDADRALLRTMADRAFDTVKASYSYDEYMPWFENLLNEAWKRADRRWPADRPWLPPAERKGVWARCRERWGLWVRAQRTARNKRQGA